MNKDILGFTQIIEILCTYTVSNLGRELATKLTPATDLARIKALQQETKEARTLLDRGGHLPLHGLADIRETVDRAQKTAVLKPGELLQVGDLLRGCRRTRTYLLAKQDIVPLLASYGISLSPLPELEELIVLCIEGSRVSDQASSLLKKIRTKINHVQDKIQSRLVNLMNSNRKYLQDHYISQRDGRWVIPVQASYKNQIPGTVVGSSGTGSTAFIEPEAIRKLTNELALLKTQEENEEYQVLAMLTGEVANCISPIKVNIQAMASLDLIMARGKFSRAMDGIGVQPRRIES